MHLTYANQHAAVFSGWLRKLPIEIEFVCQQGALFSDPHLEQQRRMPTGERDAFHDCLR
jgi:hypothetical protein